MVTYIAGPSILVVQSDDCAPLTGMWRHVNGGAHAWVANGDHRDQLFVYKGPPENDLPFNQTTYLRLTVQPYLNLNVQTWSPLLSLGLHFLIVGGNLDSKLFLTDNGFDKVVTVNPESDDGQNVRKFNITVDCMINFVMLAQWFALGVGEGRFIIIPSPQVLIPPGLARKGDSVILSGKPDEWRLQYIPINLAGGGVYELAFLLDSTFRRTDLFRKDSQQGIKRSQATSWEGKTQEWGRTPMTVCLIVFCTGRDSGVRCWLWWAKAGLAIPSIKWVIACDWCVSWDSWTGL